LAATGIAKSVSDLSVAVVSAAVLFLFVLILGTVLAQRSARFKKPLFTLIVVVVVATTLAISGATLVMNFNSPVAGPVRWASDFQIWACDNQLNLRDPRGVTNRIGTPTLFEQNDNRIHYEGTPINLPGDASLGNFMQAVGGDVSDNTLAVPLNDDNGFLGTPNAPEQLLPYLATNKDGSYAHFITGNLCGDAVSAVQTFVYHYNPATHTFVQTKLDHPAAYELSHTDQIPPGDCVIMEFAPPQDHTDHLCPGYGLRDRDRCTDFGVVADKVASCDLQELR